MKKRWFVVILTIGLLLCVLPPSVLALSPDANTDFDTITDLDGNLLDWRDLSEMGSEESLASNEATADDLNLTHDNNSADGTTPPEKSLASDEATADGPNPTPQRHDEELEDKELEDNDPADVDAPADDTDSPTTLDDGPADNPDSTTTSVCKIEKIDGTHYYSTLDDAINDATDGD